mmetsp:Transcript_10819/g.24752  ORF Transcript_10819/g.24752 Transcript_10819/m.24752 type:complete len:785 (-) Transcript_10819:95-2449(-)
MMPSPRMPVPRLEHSDTHQALWKFTGWLGHQTEIQDDQAFHNASTLASAKEQSVRRVSPFIMRQQSKFRHLFNGFLSIFLLHTGTMMPYRLAFIDYHIPDSLPQSDGYKVLDMVVEIFWIFDLVINFFFSYQDEKNEEVCDARMVASNYFRGLFFPNLIACTPEVVVAWILQRLGTKRTNSEMNKVVRLLRLQRMSRLARLMRLANVMEFMDKTFGEGNVMWKSLKESRRVRIANFMVGLLWIVHLFGCGWYLCAALHEDFTITWVARRTDPEGVSLYEKEPFDQWIHACYFVLTVFTTVGFGDVFALTTGEIMYVSLTMLAGAVVHGIIVSNVIAMITTIDESDAEASRRKDMLVHFARQTHLTEKTSEWLSERVVYGADMSQNYDKKALRNLLINGGIPRDVLEWLPGELFRGELLRNSFVQVCYSKTLHLPPRFPLLLAMTIVEHSYVVGDIVYSIFDHPFNIFMVLSGSFAYIERPEAEDGIDSQESSPNGAKVEQVHPFFAKGLGLHSASNIGFATDRSKDAAPKANGNGRKTMRARLGLTSSIARASSNPIEKSPKASAKFDQDRFSLHRPVQLFSRWSYFGDIEIMHASPRLSTVRCESHEGCVLMLAKKDIDALMHEFPHFTAAWKVAAYRRKGMYEAMIERSKRRRNQNYKHLAASIIQERYRIYKGKATASYSAASAGLVRLTSRINNTTVALEVAKSIHERDLPLPSFVDPSASQTMEANSRDFSKLRGDMHGAFESMFSIQAAMQRYFADSVAELRSDLGLEQSKLPVHFAI